ncbi:preprotein translocase subunit SecG [Buchnera aphidicola (Muscaphis stroyani)]|uniref:Protein-export membrane protein SecG n=1 Tax=Buchnera aphidicola (Muscaphis stroyani) TaxID=1241869 RepID=A0A4D6YF70_9GAMM|nr:preprotein translocase subunit SecG [Buchnera aphidicola]QCI24438.1 preprotein translocase subunit SecG [Buchnera aphidicola (Muscaphis stroyani)]
MYLCFLVFFIFISFSLISFILLQPGKSLNNTVHLNSKNNINLFKSFGRGNLITNIISVLSCLFLITSIVLCNINNSTTNLDFLKNDHKKNILNNLLSDKKEQISEIPR